MIKFFGDNFELDLTETKITLIEENPLFYNFFVKNYSWPFSKKLDDETSKKLGFIDLENSADYELKLYGKLLIDDNFESSYLLVTSFKNNTLEGIIYYGKVTMELLEVPLNELPFKTVETVSINNHAKKVISKKYPEVDYNFPMVIDEEFKSRAKYEKFEGIINQYKNGSFITNSYKIEDGKKVAHNKNVLVPYPYLMGVLKTGFDSVNIVMKGSFVSDALNNKILLDTDKFLEQFQSELPPFFQFKNSSEQWLNGFISANYNKSFILSRIGSYKLNIHFIFPSHINVIDFELKLKDVVLFSSSKNRIRKTIDINVKNDNEKGELYFSLKLNKRTDDPSDGIGYISNFNKFGFSVIDGQLNEFPKSFSLAQIMPDMSFGQLLNKIKNWLNLEITFDKNVVTMDYIETAFLDIPYKDERHLEIKDPHRIFNSNKLYKLITSNDSFFVGKNGTQNNRKGFRDEDITKINMELDLMPIRSKNKVFTAYKDKDKDDFKLFLYDGLQGNLPIAVSKVGGRNFSLLEIYNRYWKRWLSFRLNSEIYKDKFSVSIVDPLNISLGRFKYGKKHLYKKIKYRRKSEEEWEVEVESETFS